MGRTKSEIEPDARRKPLAAAESAGQSARLEVVPSPLIEILSRGRYRAFVENLDFMWRWEIHRDGEFVQEGCSLSESSSREAVGHVMTFYLRRDLSQAGDTPRPD